MISEEHGTLLFLHLGLMLQQDDWQDYLYEITPYYDKEKKQIRQKSSYLGKNVNGVPIRVRSQNQIPKKVLSHGEFIPSLKIAKDLEPEKILSGILPNKEGQNV